VGRGESLALLERHEEALLAFRDAMQDLNELESPYPVDRHALRVFLSVLSDGQRRQGRMSAAVDYARLAVELIDEGNLEQSTLLFQQLASSLVGLGDELAGDRAVESDEGRRPREVVSEQARRVLSEAAETFLEIAQRNVLKEALSAEAHWRAAELSARAGDRDRAVSLFRGFVQERPHHSLVGRALLRIGQMLQTSGRLEEAIAAYRECFARFPRGLDGSRALVPLAQCYLAMGPDHWELAERTLRIVLEESEVFTPQAPEFVDALFLMGDALNRSGQCERAIAVLEEAMERYPDEPRVMRARYLLADSYRRSGLGLKQHAAEARYAGEIEQIGEQATQRLRSAQQVYRRMIQEYESRDPADLDRLDRIHLRHAYLYEADCYFETQEYRRALKLYEDAAAMYKDSAAAPGAYVQIINCHVFLGETDEARAALARARVLVDALPEQVFDGSISPETRSDWRRYFAWLSSSELF
jgi:TolA-binding protein